MLKEKSRITATSGFTLIEIMIVVVVISILASIAYPAYMNSVTKSRRGVAKAALQDIASLQEQYYLNNKAYTADLTLLGLAADYYLNSEGAVVGAADTARIYLMTVSNVTATGYTVTATPQSSQVARDTECGTMTLSQDGTRTVSGTGAISSCW